MAVAPPPPVPRSRAPVSALLLLVDDEPVVRFAVSDYLERAGYSVQSAIDLPTATLRAREAAYDMVISDLVLDAGDPNGGFEVIDAVRRRSPGAVAVLVTAHGTPEVVAEARRRGIDAVVLKPVGLRDLRRLTAELLGLKACFR